MRSNLYKLVIFSKRYSKEHIAIICDLHPSEQAEQRLGKNSIFAARFQWKRKSADSTADAIRNNAHTGMKSILLTARDLLFSATYDCEHLKED